MINEVMGSQTESPEEKAKTPEEPDTHSEMESPEGKANSPNKEPKSLSESLGETIEDFIRKEKIQNN